MMFRTSGVDGGWIFPGSSSGELRFRSELRSVRPQRPIRPVQGRFVPSARSSSAREYRGTGVVLPRILEDEDVKGGREQQKRQATGNGGNREQEKCNGEELIFSSPSQEWTY
ncbi:hypothetical protein C4D60_Mb06t18480 [Musa balbisiana]|uniref:Uncharacterized protein n=1 Tax=Musa balbisiana TaxID=52838 RepID=A0A4V4H402_MUSBA|nr:hypothetical protein C4D60_Mb06t18480 [Musa balbisiana]